MKTTILNHLQSALTSVKEVFARRADDVRINQFIRDAHEREETVRTEQAATLLKTKQAVARNRLGTKHIHHADYRFDPRHSNDTSIYPHFREHYLNEVRDAAEVARSDNPAHTAHAARLYHMATAKGARASRRANGITWHTDPLVSINE